MTVFLLIAAVVILASLAAQFFSRAPTLAMLARGIGMGVAIIALLALARSSPDGFVGLAGGFVTASVAILLSAWN